MKRIITLIVSFCILLSAGGQCVFAAEILNPASGAPQDYFYKIFHLDAARKYFTVENIKDLIDEAADADFNQIELYLSDNQGFRLALDDMTVTTEFGTYDMTPALGAGYSQDPHYTDGKEIWLTQQEMDEIIAYANRKGLDVVPCMNAPGHMGALLEAFPEFRYSTTINGSTAVSKSALNLWNEEAYAFGLAFIEKYAEYFKSRGVKVFNFGADEYGCDLMTNSGTGENNGMDIVYNNGGYEFKATTSTPYTSWYYNSNGIYAYIYGANYYMCYNTNGWFGGDGSNAYAHYVAYEAEEIPAATETVITITGLAAGTTEVEIDGVKYVITVSDDA